MNNESLFLLNTCQVRLMNGADDSELHRLCAQLEQIYQNSPLSDLQKEALKKASLALIVAFRHDLREEVENQYTSLGQPLTEKQRQDLLSMGIDPDAD